MGIKKETGEQRQFSTGAKKQAATGKGTPVLFPGDAYLEVCKHFEAGAAIYGGRNWEKGIPLSEIINSLERHIAQEKMGLTDEAHDRAIAWNAIVYLATKLRIEAGILPKELADIQTIYNNKVKEEDLGEIKHPICPLNMYFEGDENICDNSKCDYLTESRGCSEQCQIKPKLKVQGFGE